MVISAGHDANKITMDSQPLKFGMDRILSEDISSKRKNIEGLQCTSSPPCTNCLSSLYRCCRSSTLSAAPSGFYKTVIHAPQPLRPYSGVLVKEDSSIHVSHQQVNPSGGSSKRKRSWSRAVFSNLQRKGLEKRFQLQKYITKPDRRQLAATLGLSDAQVKVWFQNRRMKWRHTKETTRQSYTKNQSGDNIIVAADSENGRQSDSDIGSDIDVQTIES